MILFRSILYYVFLTVSVAAFGIPLALAGWIMPLSWRQSIASAWGLVNLAAQKAICGLGYVVSGEEHLSITPAIVMSKHQSAWETIALRALVDSNQAWVLKRELMWLPVFGWALAILGSIAIDRKAGKKAARQVVEQGKNLLSQGCTVIIFPEGTRTAPGLRKKYGIGGGLLAEKTQVPVIPIAHNAGVFWRRRGIRKYPGTIQVVVGEPMEVNGLSAAQITRNVETWIESVQNKLPLTPNELVSPVDEIRDLDRSPE